MITKPQIWLNVSLATMLVSILIVGIIRPVWGIDFTGGTLLEITGDSITVSSAQNALEELGLSGSVQASEEQRVIVRLEPISEEKHQEVLTALKTRDDTVEELRYESIGPTIGAELRSKAWWAIGLVIVVTILYLAYTFRSASGLIASWKFGVAATFALIHDVLVVLAVFVLLGAWLGVQIDTLFVTAMLALLGYSVNDTIVLFNRLREEWIMSRSGNFVEIIDRAAKATLVRSFNTSLTTLLVLTALLFFGGASIRWFVAALTIGTVVGTYSSIFVAPPMLNYLAKR